MRKDLIFLGCITDKTIEYGHGIMNKQMPKKEFIEKQSFLRVLWYRLELAMASFLLSLSNKV